MNRCLAVVVLLLTHPALASTVRSTSEPEMVALADTIVVGSVVQTEVVPSPQGPRTEVLLQVHRGIRGAREGDTITVDLPGGTLGGVTSSISGTPKFVPGQMVVAFLETHGRVRRPLGLAYGVYAIDGAWQAQRDLRGLSLINARGQVQSAVGLLPPEGLDRLLARIDAIVRTLPRGAR